CGDCRRQTDLLFSNLSLPARRATSSLDGAQRRGGSEALEQLPPKDFSLGGVLLLQPPDVVPIGARGDRSPVLSLAQGLVQGENPVQDDHIRAAIRQDVMKSPNAAVVGLSDSKQR